MDINWQKQEGDSPLFPDTIWQKPEQKRAAGRLALLGGHQHGFNLIGRAYQAALESGIGEAKVILPNKLEKLLKPTLPDAVFAASTSSGNLSQDGYDAVKSYLDWASGTLVMQTGDNSETTVLINRLLSNLSDHRFILTDEVVGLLAADIKPVCDQPNRLWVLSFDGVQKLARLLNHDMAFISDMGLRPFVLALNDLAGSIAQPLVVVYEDVVVVASNGQVTSTKRSQSPDLAMLAGSMAVWWLQQPDSPLEALTCAAFEF